MSLINVSLNMLRQIDSWQIAGLSFAILIAGVSLRFLSELHRP